MKSTTFNVLVGTIAIIGMVAVSLAWEFSLWNECRVDHSFWYCARVLGH